MLVNIEIFFTQETFDYSSFTPRHVSKIPRLLFGLALGGHGGNGLGHGLFVAQELETENVYENPNKILSKILHVYLHGLNWLHVFVELVEEGDAGGQVDAHDLLVAHVIQVLHDSSEKRNLKNKTCSTSKRNFMPIHGITLH